MKAWLKIILSCSLFLVVAQAVMPKDLEKLEDTLLISGKPARSGFLKEVTQRFIQRNKIGKPFLKEVIFPGQLDPEDKILVRIPLRKNNKQKDLHLMIKNELLVPVAVSKLWVSNNPEKVYQAGVLFEGILKKRKAVRLLYYHMNKSIEKRQLALVVENRAGTSLRLHLESGLAGPGKDEVYLGHLATKRYLAATLTDEGEYIKVPPFSAQELFVQDFAPEQILTGVIKLTLLSGKNALVYLTVADTQNLGGARLVKVTKRIKELSRGGVFRHTKRTIKKKYIVGKPAKEIRLGDKPFVRDERTNHVLKGNYGVEYKLLLSFENPTAEDKTVQVVFKPAGGLARGIFLIGDKIKETSWLKPGGSPDREVIYSVYLATGQKRSVEILTMPQAGSYYPVSLVFREK